MALTTRQLMKHLGNARNEGYESGYIQAFSDNFKDDFNLWIKLSEREPVEEKEYLCLLKTVNGSEYKVLKWSAKHKAFTENDLVNYYMELPTPPIEIFSDN